MMFCLGQTRHVCKVIMFGITCMCTTSMFKHKRLGMFPPNKNPFQIHFNWIFHVEELHRLHHLPVAMRRNDVSGRRMRADEETDTLPKRARHGLAASIACETSAMARWSGTFSSIAS